MRSLHVETCLNCIFNRATLASPCYAVVETFLTQLQIELYEQCACNIPANIRMPNKNVRYQRFGTNVVVSSMTSAEN